MSAVPSTVDRVPAHTKPERNAGIRRETVASIARHAGESTPQRLAELKREWDIERIIECNASALALAGTLLGAFVSPWFLLIPFAVTSFLLQHAIQGWCPPVPILRRLGKRTSYEIDNERHALKALRGDYIGLGTTTNPDDAEAALEAAEK